MANTLLSNSMGSFSSIKSAVAFIDTLDQYCYKEDLPCKFKFNSYTPQEGDRVAIFKLGWTYVKDYFVFEWAPVSCTDEEYSEVVFNKHILPKNQDEMYQFCYVSGENELHGASLPFSFSTEKSTTSTALEACSTKLAAITETESAGDTISTELKKLREENDILKEALKALVSERNQLKSKDYDKDITELRGLVDDLKNMFVAQQEELAMLKEKFLESGEEYKKLYLEKAKLESKIKKHKGKKDEEKIKESDDVGEKKTSDSSGQSKISPTLTFDIRDLKSIPPFPFLK